MLSFTIVPNDERVDANQHLFFFFPACLLLRALQVENVTFFFIYKRCSCHCRSSSGSQSYNGFGESLWTDAVILVIALMNVEPSGGAGTGLHATQYSPPLIPNDPLCSSSVRFRDNGTCRLLHMVKKKHRKNDK